MKKEIDEVNAQLLLAISDGRKTDIDAWQKTDIFEFFTFLNAKQSMK